MDISALTHQFKLPDGIFQDRDALECVRAIQTLPDLARSYSLRIGLLLAAAVATTNAGMRQHSMEGLKETAKGLTRLRDFLETPSREGEVHPVAAELLKEVFEMSTTGHRPVKELAQAATNVVNKRSDGQAPTEDDLMAVMHVAHGDFPQWVSDFAQRVEDVGSRTLAELRAHTREAQDGAMASQSRIADVARTIRLISLNARVEAARAGEAGRAFGVIADEIKALSERTSQASEDLARDIDRMADIVGG